MVDLAGCAEGVHSTQAGSWLLSPVDQEMLLQRAGVFLGLLCLPLGTQAGFRDRIQARNKKICKDRQLNQFFRKETETNCAKVVKCVADRGDLKLIPTACSPPLVFDIDSQICNYEEQVNNCDRQDKDPELEEDAERNILLEQAKAEKEEEGACDLSTCVLPSCFCSADGTQAPGGLELENIPQMINFAFNGAVNGENMAIYDRLFKKERVNPNGCQVKGTFFVSHKYTNYSSVQEMHYLGHEIAAHSITHKDDEQFWSSASTDNWAKEMAGSRLIIDKFANITDNSVVGLRAPYLRVGGNSQFTMMEEQAFLYDSSITAPLQNPPLWPYTMYFRMPHRCHGDLQNCPTRSHAVWEMVMNELDRREDPTVDEDLPGCAMVDSCSNILSGDQFYNFLTHNFYRHYDQNRAPLGLFFHAAWLKNNPEYLDAFLYWMDEILETHNDVYFVTMTQVIQWIQNPQNSDEAKTFEPWREKCSPQPRQACIQASNCKLSSNELPGELLHMHTCVRCPNNYPWINDPTGDGIF